MDAVDKLLQERVSTLDKQKRSRIYQQAAQVMSQDLPQVFLYQYGLPIAYSNQVHWNPEWAPVVFAVRLLLRYPKLVGYPSVIQQILCTRDGVKPIPPAVYFSWPRMWWDRVVGK
ncbi:hypothetical protein [Alicyclobacillus pomorum]|uniref:hypothetical protein n=1 Tax=Alicyclobacillus pomorum TaxID=204470 RepID=UPI000423F621|nr:hypothetical protein [Alicyclobacillus pomorum]